MIFIRCDANPQLGMGHLTRCRALGGALAREGRPCVMVGPSPDYRIAGDDESFVDWIEMPFAPSPEADAARLVRLISDDPSASAVLDDYRVNEDYQLALRDAGVQWLQFNGRPALPLWADLVLNPSPAATADLYAASIMNPAANLLLGPQFAILRPEFGWADTAPRQGAAKRILVTFGGGDDRGGVLAVLKTLLPAVPSDVQFVVMSGEHNPHNAEIAGWITTQAFDRAELHVNPADIAGLISTCDLAITAGGGTIYEVNYFGLPMLLVSISENQVAHSMAWERTGAARYLGDFETLDPDALLAETERALGDGSGGRNGAHRLVDGLGGTRVARRMIEQFAL